MKAEANRVGLRDLACKPRKGWSKAFKQAACGDESDLRTLRSSTNAFDHREWKWSEQSAP